MQVLVVGAGVVGLAVARAAALRGHEVIVAICPYILPPSGYEVCAE
jgi:NADPH-dependent 2,4-dienoyl-CoA reductase/sulfur reductase-like enzyme